MPLKKENKRKSLAVESDPLGEWRGVGKCLFKRKVQLPQTPDQSDSLGI